MAPVWFVLLQFVQEVFIAPFLWIRHCTSSGNIQNLNSPCQAGSLRFRRRGRTLLKLTNKAIISGLRNAPKSRSSV